MSKMQIGQVARGAGLTVDAIRFYERRGLLPKPARSEGGFRLYAPSDVMSLRFIRRMQALGFSLKEIRELLALRSREHACAQVSELLGVKLAAVRGKIAELRALQRHLNHALGRCNRQMRRNRKRAHRCPVLERAHGRNDKQA